MEICIKSETDSRIFLYPLIKVLSNYGTVCVYSSNRMLTRLIENDMEGGFKNIRIMVSTEADLDACKESDEWYKGKYDFCIYDNMNIQSYDILICLVTNRLSETYVQDLTYLITDPKVHIIKFGAPAPITKDKNEKPKKETKPKGGAVEEDFDDTEFNKWHVEKTDEELLTEALSNRETKWCKFPSLESIDQMESRHIMLTPDDGLIKELFRLFGEKLNVDERMFTKGARVKDESSSDISGTDVR